MNSEIFRDFVKSRRPHHTQKSLHCSEASPLRTIPSSLHPLTACYESAVVSFLVTSVVFWYKYIYIYKKYLKRLWIFELDGAIKTYFAYLLTSFVVWWLSSVHCHITVSEKKSYSACQRFWLVQTPHHSLLYLLFHFSSVGCHQCYFCEQLLAID